MLRRSTSNFMTNSNSARICRRTPSRLSSLDTSRAAPPHVAHPPRPLARHLLRLALRPAAARRRRRHPRQRRPPHGPHRRLVTLHVNGIRYLEKAPLPYWLVALSFRIFGFNTFAAHLPQALAVLLSRSSASTGPTAPSATAPPSTPASPSSPPPESSSSPASSSPKSCSRSSSASRPLLPPPTSLEVRHATNPGAPVSAF